MENQQYMQEDEIDLRECINILIKRRKLVLVIFIVSIVTTVLANLWIPKIYEITSTIQLGSVDELLIKKEEAEEIILSQNSLLSIIKELNLKIGAENLKKDIKINGVNGTNLLKINIVYPDINIALKINDLVVSPLITQGQIIYQERLSLVKERLKELDGEIKSIEEDINMKKARISGEPRAKRWVILQTTPVDYENKLTELRNQKNELKLLLINAKDFRIFDQPIESKNPIKLKQQKVSIIAQLILLLGVLLVFFKEFWQKGKKGKLNNERSLNY